MSDAFRHPPGGRGGEVPHAGDPVSWLQIEQGWRVVSADGEELGTVAQVAGSPSDDIFDGLAVDRGDAGVVYAPGEQVGAITVGTVTLKLTAADAARLGPYAEAPPQTALRPGPGSLGGRLGRWLGRR